MSKNNVNVNAGANAEVNAEVEARTLEVVSKELEKAIDDFNTEENVVARVKLEKKIIDLKDEYNNLSLLTVYSNCAKTNCPVAELAKLFYYNTVLVKKDTTSNVENGILIRSEKYYSVEKPARINLKKFLEWATKSNRKVTAVKSWLPEVGSARRSIIAEIKKHKESKDGAKISKSVAKKAVQKAFDALAFIPGEKGNNAIIAKGNVAGLVIDLAATLKITVEDGSTDPSFDEKFLEDKNWYPLLMTMLHLTVKNKDYKVTYCDNDDPEAEAETESNSKTEQKPETAK